MKKSKSILSYLREIWEGKDKKPSGKRILGIILIFFSCFLAFYAVVKIPERLPDIALLVTPFLGGGLAFWGISEWSNIMHRKRDNESSFEPPNYD